MKWYQHIFRYVFNILMVPAFYLIKWMGGHQEITRTEIRFVAPKGKHTFVLGVGTYDDLAATEEEVEG